MFFLSNFLPLSDIYQPFVDSRKKIYDFSFQLDLIYRNKSEILQIFFIFIRRLTLIYNPKIKLHLANFKFLFQVFFYETRKS